MENESRIEYAEDFRNAFEEYVSLCRIPAYIRLRNDEIREITPSDYRISLPSPETDKQGYILYVEMKERAFLLLVNRCHRMEKEYEPQLKVCCAGYGIVILEGAVRNVFVQYAVFGEDNL